MDGAIVDVVAMLGGIAQMVRAALAKVPELDPADLTDDLGAALAALG